MSIHQKVAKDFTLLNNSTASKEKRRESEAKSMLVLAKYANVGYYLITPLVVGVFFGLLADSYFKTKPMFTIVGLVIGTIGIFYNLYKTTKDASY